MDHPGTPRFHLAFPVTDLESSRRFYVEVLGCRVGRESNRWIDFDFYGHQITGHLAPEQAGAASTTPVDGHPVPVRHFGVILPWDDWHALSARLSGTGIAFLIPPHVRFRGQPGEQATLFITDPSGNGLEFKSFRDASRLFAR
ncbi:MAG: glyoxalase [Chromatiales bacterium 21-64-14]|nr:MAG: glyoxalase [Chromatiales bacterium 21-64-14]HQU15185.1 VOC family protein [Gammaproteobacteria bacterium]